MTPRLCVFPDQQLPWCHVDHGPVTLSTFPHRLPLLQYSQFAPAPGRRLTRETSFASQASVPSTQLCTPSPTLLACHFPPAEQSSTAHLCGLVAYIPALCSHSYATCHLACHRHYECGQPGYAASPIHG
eukprot:2763936-Amphidinium_carterae.1